MTRVLLFSDDPTVAERFATIGRSRSCELELHPGGAFKQVTSEITAPSLCYLDVDSDGPVVKRTLKEHLEHPSIRLGIVDRSGSIADVAELFHLGAVDYLGPELLKADIPAKRLKAVFDHRPVPTGGGEPGRVGPTAWRPVTDGSWHQVTSGEEYTFVLLYVEIELTEEWRKKSGKEHLDEVKAAFHRHVEQVIRPRNGKVWMWTDLGGIVLFPFDGEHCPVIESCMKLILDRAIISAEWYAYNTLITYRMAIHIGNTTYRERGDTGTLISDTVNFVFHLGQKYLESGNLFITATAAEYLDPGLAQCFVPAGTFEQMAIRRMKRPVR